VLKTDKASAAAQAADEALAGSAWTRVSALRLADRLGHPDPLEQERGARQPRLAAARRHGTLWDAPTMDGGKVFSGLYALYAGLVFVVAAGLVCVPVLYRL